MKKQINYKVSGEEWSKAKDKAFAKVSKNAKVDGFRQGKVPRNVFEKKYGTGDIVRSAMEDLIDAKYGEIIVTEKLIPAVEPKLEIVSADDDGFEVNITIITDPEVKLGKYKELKVKKDKVEVTKEEIEHELSHLLEKYSELVVKENGTVENGDVAIIDFEGFKDGVAFEGGKGENYSLEIGSNTFIPGFEEQLIGMKALEEKEINVTFPEDYAASDLAGCAVIFKVKVNEVKTKEVRELDKDFFDDLGMEGIDSKEKLEKEIEANIKANKDVDAENKYIDSLLAEISKNVEVDIPEEMVDDEIHHMIHRFEDQLKMQGISLDMYYQFTGSDENMLHSQMEKEAYEHILYRLTLEEIMKLEKVEVTDKEVEDEIKSLTEKYSMKEEDLLKAIGSKNMIKYDLEMRKVIELLKEANK